VDRDSAGQHDVKVTADLPLLDDGFTGQSMVLMRGAQNAFGLITVERGEERD
jgi:hypothetical protein